MRLMKYGSRHLKFLRPLTKSDTPTCNVMMCDYTDVIYMQKGPYGSVFMCFLTNHHTYLL